MKIREKERVRVVSGLLVPVWKSDPGSRREGANRKRRNYHKPAIRAAIGRRTDKQGKNVGKTGTVGEGMEKIVTGEGATRLFLPGTQKTKKKRVKCSYVSHLSSYTLINCG